MNVQSWAERFLFAGIAVIPVHYKDKKPIGEWRQYQTTLPSQLNKWFARPINYGVVVGWRNLVVIDFDTLTEYSRWALWAQRRAGLAAYVLNTAFKVKTARGIHVYITTTEPAQNHKLPGIDIKSRGGYVLGPGSIHPTGVEYKPLQDVLNFPEVDRLSDAIPAGILIETPLASQVTRPAQAQAIQANDLWADAIQDTPGRGVVEKIKARMRIEDFFTGAQHTGKGWLVDLCPFHDDKSPSFWLNTEQQICGCFSCQMKPMDAINLYARLHGLNNDDAVRVLARTI